MEAPNAFNKLNSAQQSLLLESIMQHMGKDEANAD